MVSLSCHNCPERLKAKFRKRLTIKVKEKLQKSKNGRFNHLELEICARKQIESTHLKEPASL